MWSLVGVRLRRGRGDGRYCGSKESVSLTHTLIPPSLIPPLTDEPLLQAFDFKLHRWNKLKKKALVAQLVRAMRL